MGLFWYLQFKLICDRIHLSIYFLTVNDGWLNHTHKVRFRNRFLVHFHTSPLWFIAGVSVCLSLNTKCDYIFQLRPSHSLFGHHAITFPLPHLISTYFRTGYAPLLGLIVHSHNETSKSGTTAKAYIKINKQANRKPNKKIKNRSSSTFFFWSILAFFSWMSSFFLNVVFYKLRVHPPLLIIIITDLLKR